MHLLKLSVSCLFVVLEAKSSSMSYNTPSALTKLEVIPNQNGCLNQICQLEPKSKCFDRGFQCSGKVPCSLELKGRNHKTLKEVTSSKRPSINWCFNRQEQKPHMRAARTHTQLPIPLNLSICILTDNNTDHSAILIILP